MLAPAAVTVAVDFDVTLRFGTDPTPRRPATRRFRSRSGSPRPEAARSPVCSKP